MIALAFDLLLAAALLIAAAGALSAADMVRAVMLYLAFGVLMVVAWVRLFAPDLGLAEAGIGMGVTGALMLDALGRLIAVGHRRGGGDEPS
jgi:uncharacterized MnhB-related membrane protein